MFYSCEGCTACNLAGCLDCSNLTHCLACDTANGYTLDGEECSYCNNTLDLFIDGEICKPCSIDKCIDCSNLTTCIACNSS